MSISIYNFTVMKNCTNVKCVFKMYKVNIIKLKRKSNSMLLGKSLVPISVFVEHTMYQLYQLRKIIQLSI